MADEQLQEIAPSGTQANTIPLLDSTTNAVVHMPFDDAAGLIKSGRYSLPRGFQLPVVNPEGQPGTVDASEASSALQSGFSLDSLEDQRQRQLQAQYGSAPQVVAAGAAGAARGLTFGLSDQLLTAAGVRPQTLTGLEEANPIVSTAGEAGGIGLGLLGPSELGIAAKGAEVAGKATENFLVRQAGKVGLKNSVARSIVEKIAPKAIGSAVEGTFYGAGNLLSEDALGRADFNAESLAAHLGTGALIGGAFGGAFATGAELMGPIGKVVDVVGSPFKKKVEQGLDADVSSARLFGMTPTQYQKFEQRNPKIASEMKDYLVKDLKLGITDSAEDLAAKNAAIQESSGKNIGGILDEIDSAIVGRPDLKPNAEQIYGNMANKIENEILNPLKEVGAPGSKTAIQEVEKFLNEIDELRAAGGEFKASDLQKIKKAEDKLIKYNKVPGQFSIGDELRFATRTAIRDEIDSLAAKLEGEGLAPELSTRLKEANRQYAASASLSPFIERRALKAADRDFSFMNAAKDAATDASRKLVVLGKIENAKQIVDKAISKTADSLVGLGKAIDKADVPVITGALMSTDLAKDFTEGKAHKAKTRQEAYQNIIKNITKFQQSPEQFMERVGKQTSAVFNVAPKTAGHLDVVAMNALQFLSSKVPKKSAVPSLLDVYKKPKQPSSMQMAKFERYMQAITKPMDVMKHLQAGTVTREETDALKAVYPVMFENLRNAVIDRLPGQAEKIPYNKRVNLGLLFDVPADQSMQGQNVMALQANFEQENDQPQPAGDMSAIAKSDRIESGADDIADSSDA